MTQVRETKREVVEGPCKIRIECSWSICCKLSIQLNCLLNGWQSLLSMTQVRKMIGEVIEGPCKIRIECSWIICCKLSIQLNCILNGKQGFLWMIHVGQPV